MKDIPNKFINWLKNSWKAIVISLLIISAGFATLNIQPKVIHNQANIYEAATVLKVNSPDKPWYRSVNAPFLIPSVLVNKVTNNSLNSTRFVSAVFTLIAIILFYLLVKIWFNGRMALVGSILLLTNSITLNLAHQGAPFAALLLAPLAIFISYNWFVRTKSNRFLSFMTFIAVIAVSAYIPFMLWLILIAVTALSVYSNKKLKKLKIWQLLLAGCLYLIILVPLFVSLMGAPGQIRELLGIPLQLVDIKQYVFGIAQIISSIFIIAPAMPIIFLGNLPILDVFTAIMAILGMYFYIKRLKHRRSMILLSALFVMISVMALSSNFQIYSGLLLAFMYIFAITGIIEILKQWYAYFPRNPLVRNFGVALVVIAIGLVSFYQLERYYVAWANAPETKAAYMIKYQQG